VTAPRSGALLTTWLLQESAILATDTLGRTILHLAATSRDISLEDFCRCVGASLTSCERVHVRACVRAGVRICSILVVAARMSAVAIPNLTLGSVM